MWKGIEKTGRESHLFGTLWRGTKTGIENKMKTRESRRHTDKRHAESVSISLSLFFLDVRPSKEFFGH